MPAANLRKPQSLQHVSAYLPTTARQQQVQKSHFYIICPYTSTRVAPDTSNTSCAMLLSRSAMPITNPGHIKTSRPPDLHEPYMGTKKVIKMSDKKLLTGGTGPTHAPDMRSDQILF